MDSEILAPFDYIPYWNAKGLKCKKLPRSATKKCKWLQPIQPKGQTDWFCRRRHTVSRIIAKNGIRTSVASLSWQYED